MRIHNEYNFVAKRALMNYMANSRTNLEKHFHGRTVNMLKNVIKHERYNMDRELKAISTEAYKATMEILNEDPAQLLADSFESALDGLKKGKMTYTNDPVLPVLIEQIKERT